MTGPVPGKFVTLEGIDGAGKSSHLETVRTLLARRGIDTLTTREPGGTPLGEKLREILLRDAMHPDTEALLIFAARAEHLATVIRPALARGTWVLSDRFTDATFAYQGAGRGMADDRLRALETWVQRGLQPDLTILFDVPAVVGMGRRLAASESLDRFEREQLDFFDRVRQGYLSRAKASGGRMAVIDADRPIADIRVEVKKLVVMLCK